MWFVGGFFHSSRHHSYVPWDGKCSGWMYLRSTLSGGPRHGTELSFHTSRPQPPCCGHGREGLVVGWTRWAAAELGPPTDHRFGTFKLQLFSADKVDCQSLRARLPCPVHTSRPGLRCLPPVLCIWSASDAPVSHSHLFPSTFLLSCITSRQLPSATAAARVSTLLVDILDYRSPTP